MRTSPKRRNAKISGLTAGDLSKGGMSNTTREIVMLDALALSRAIRLKQVSCLEVMKAYLDHIEQLNPRVNAIVSMRDRGELIAEAQNRDAQLARGDYLGWMHGFPQAIKDLEATAGVRTTLGSPLFKNFIPPHDSILVERIKRAGAIIIGKTNTPEFGLGSHTYNAVFGTTLNAYDQTKTAGGSSGGAAVALGLRMLPVADGSDHAGSLRNPAAFNNVLGFRTCFGRVPSDWREVFSPSLAVHGPMARKVGDLAMLLSTIAGYDPRVPYSLREDPNTFATDLACDIQGTRIAWSGDFAGYLPFEPGVLEVCEKALSTFRKLGCTVECAVPDYPIEQVWRSWLMLRGAQVSAILKPLFLDPEKRNLMKPEAQWEAERGLKMNAGEVYDASVVRTNWYQSVRKLFERYDYCIMPSAQVFPFDAQLHWPDRINGRVMDTYHRWMEVVIPATMSGCPSLNVPAGFGTAGLPMGIQIIGPNHGEFKCLQLAWAYEQETRWVDEILAPLLS
jgi:amidase